MDLLVFTAHFFDCNAKHEWIFESKKVGSQCRLYLIPCDYVVENSLKKFQMFLGLEVKLGLVRSCGKSHWNFVPVQMIE